MNIIGLSGLDNSVRFKKREFPHLSSRQLRFAQGFDSAAVLLTSYGIQAAAAEERFTGDKATGAFPVQALRYCLEAGGVTAEAAAQYFDIRNGEESTYAHMLFVAHVRKPYQAQLPAVTHVDGSARVQTVAQADHPRFWQLLKAFGKISGMPILLNTSFNVRGQPIVRTPQEAVDTFLNAQLDALVISHFLVTSQNNQQQIGNPPGETCHERQSENT